MTPKTIRLCIVLGGLLLFIPNLGNVHLFDWDEVNFAECAREMIVTGDYLHVTIDYAPFHEKPPLFIWLQAISMLTFGVNEFAARLPNALIGVATLLLIFNIGTRLYDMRFGLLWVLAYAGSILPQFYIRSAIIDPLFNLFIFLAIDSLFRTREVPRAVYLAGLYSGLAVLTKGPVGWGLIILTLCVAWFIERRTYAFPIRQILIVTGITALTAGLWLGLDYVQNGPQFVSEHIAYQYRLLTTGEAGHEQPFYYHAFVVLIGCYPASILFFQGFRASKSESTQQHAYRLWMIIVFAVVLVIFSVVKTKIIHYSSMTYLPLTFLAAVAIHRWLRRIVHINPSTRMALLAMCLLWAILAAAVPLAFMNSDWLLSLPTFRDAFLRASLQQRVVWTGFEPLLAIILLAGGVFAVFTMRTEHKRMLTVSILFGSVIAFVTLFLPLVAPLIERYTQGAAVGFYKSKQGQSVYVEPLTMKSYAHLFYSLKPQELSSSAKRVRHEMWEYWLLRGNIDRPAYFVSKINDAPQWRAHSNLRVIGEHGGFVFFERVNAQVDSR